MKTFDKLANLIGLITFAFAASMVAGANLTRTVIAVTVVAVLVFVAQPICVKFLEWFIPWIFRKAVTWRENKRVRKAETKVEVEAAETSAEPVENR